MDCILAATGISLAGAAAFRRNRDSRDNSFIESPEVGDALTAHRESLYEVRIYKNTTTGWGCCNVRLHSLSCLSV